ncbi:hypothetical protein [Paenochrobactrum glaciei]|uniref:hypothetical protein n=1 Tax=Paenochrobactrum glaciei TaxID=486407 RepID=UPI0031CF9FE7
MKAIPFPLRCAWRAEAFFISGATVKIAAALLTCEMLVGFQRTAIIAEAGRHSCFTFMWHQLPADAADRTAVGFCRCLRFPTRRTFQRRPAGKRLPLEKDTASPAFYRD